MEKEQLDKLIKVFEELNVYMENISSRLSIIDDCMDSCLDLVKKEIAKEERPQRTENTGINKRHDVENGGSGKSR